MIFRKNTIWLPLLLALTSCAEANLVGSGPNGGYVRNIGWNPLYKHYLPQKAADQHCAHYGKKAIFVGDAAAPEVDFKCVDKAM